MNISWKWLGELVDLKHITPEQLAEKLTLAGFEIESIQADDVHKAILDISNTTNRPDTMHIIGIAKEIATILQSPLELSWTQVHLPIKRIYLKSNQITYTDQIISHISNIHVSESPQWLKDRLKLYNIKSQNNLVDIINFIAIKWSQHITIFDYTKLKEKYDIKYTTDSIDHINLKILDKEEQATTHYEGVTSNFQNLLDQNTTEILVQAKIFTKTTVRQILQNIELEPHLAFLYKKESYNNDLLDAYSEAILLINSLCKSKTYNICYISTAHKIYRPIKFNSKKLNTLLGPVKATKDISRYKYKEIDWIQKIFHNLNLILHSGSDNYNIEIPLYRLNDLAREIDLIEEISRIYGFDHFVDKIPIHHKVGAKTISKYRIVHIRSVLRSIGMHETVHSSLANADNNNVNIYNPLTTEYKNLRNNLIGAIIDASTYNLNQGNYPLEIFEIGRIFQNHTNNYNETTHIAGIIGGSKHIRTEWDQKPISLSWFQAKGDMEEIFERLNIPVQWKKPDKNFYIYKNTYKYFHPKYISVLYINQNPIGIFGQLSIILDKTNITNKIYAFELSIDKLLIQPTDKTINRFYQYPKYPAIVRDINIKFSENISLEKILDILDNHDNPIIESVQLFDVYKQSTQNSYCKSLSFRITYRNPNNTLTNKQVDSIESQIKNQLKTKITCITNI
uniref:phenylalanine--tRNA ligase n=1 Tax=Liagoropsis maxima TaxID=1653392 RepID=A0A1G4NW22_9FLOR|nr:Phenylalanine-tRNA ligase beta subunit [Liagoropsis maxima]SCW22872.1 Phenylalanine-tRNA ligase beta subunit [Liagoropsis maxima]